MRKILVKILSSVLCLCMLFSLVGCNGCNEASNWTATKMNNWGNVISSGGFVAETENYVYYVNGVADTRSNNTYGKPVKGALMVADKTDLTKTEIAVPKLFGAGDYSAGLYLCGEYVYYGTPNTDKASDGSVAYSEMMFRRAKLDGSVDEHLLTINTLSAEYRFAQKDGVVYIVYYDKDQTAIVSYNTANKESVIVAKTDEKTAGNESLGAYVFLNNEMTDKAVVVYTTVVYNLPYNEDMNEGTGATRPAESYNKVYAYSVGDSAVEQSGMYGKVVYDGKQDQNTYSILNNDKNYIYINKAEEFGKESAFALTVEELLAKDKTADAGVEVVSEYASAKGNLVVDLDNVYILPVSENSESNQSAESTGPVKLYKDTMRVKDNSATIDHAQTKELVAVCDSIHALLLVHEDYVYYHNTDLQIMRVNAGNPDAEEERVSDDTSTGLATWFAPEIVSAGGKDYLFYCDTSSLGLSYTRYIDLDAEVEAEDTDDDDENDLFYLKGSKFIGKMLDSDTVKYMQTKVDNLANELSDGGVLLFDKDEDGNYVKDSNGKTVLKVSAVEEVRAEYNALPQAIKEDLSIVRLEDYERAIELANVFFKLDGIENVSLYEEGSEKFNEYKAIYQQVKPTIEEYYNSGEYSSIGPLLSNNLKANYSKAQTLFEAEKK